MNSIEQTIKQKAKEIGFSFCNIAPADIRFDSKQIQSWYEKDNAADMQWLIDNMDKRENPNHIFEQAKSIIVCGLSYYQPKPERQGNIARYALGRDYHKVIKKKLQLLISFLQQYNAECRAFVDTAPILERPIAEIAGAGWQGKSSLLIRKDMGNYFFLGEIFTSLQLQPDSKHENLCGTCTKCIDACPTGAITEPYVVDANRCISYLTIENKGAIPEQFRSAIGDKLYGCDMCSDLCPWNKFAQLTTEDDFQARQFPDVREILRLSESEFLKVFAGSPIHRIKLERLQRNACVVLGNIGDENDIELLETIFINASELVKEHARWAIDGLRYRI